MFSVCRASVLLVCVCAAAAAQTATFQVPAISFAALSDAKDAAALLRLRDALGDLGLASISDVPGLAEHRRRGLRAAAACLPTLPGALRVTLPDGSLRVSVGASSRAGSSSNWDSASLSQQSEACAEFARASHGMRRALALVEGLLISRLDALCGLRPDALLPRNDSSRPSFGSASELALSGWQLEHAHVYAPSQTAAPASALPMHTDAGLFLTFLPELFPDEADFAVQLRSGREAAPRFAAGGDVAAVMVGSAFSQLLNPHAEFPLRPVPHRMSLHGRGGPRAWLGRMALPAPDALLPGLGLSFAEHLATAPREDVAPASEGACAADEIWCWMMCMQAPDTCAASDAKCLKPDGSPWNPTEHCTSCAPQCPAAPEPASNGFCNGHGTLMYMDGVHWLGGAHDACVVLLFPALTLDSAPKYWLAVVAVFVFGAGVEALGKARRAYLRTASKGARRRCGAAALHGVQLGSAYAAMLFVMSYSAPIMLATVLGLVAGHSVFSEDNAGAGESSVEPCCALAGGEGGCCATAGDAEDDLTEPLLQTQ